MVPNSDTALGPVATPTDDTRWTSTLIALWKSQQSWSEAANQLKAGDRSVRGPLVVLGFLGVVVSTVSPQLVDKLATVGAATDTRNWAQLGVTLVGPGLVAICAVFTHDLLGPKRIKAWPRARSVAERLKAQGYLYAVGAPPYSDTAKAPALLTKAKNQLTLVDPEVDIPLKPVDKLRGTHPTAPINTAQYVTQRAGQQRDYHLREAVRYRAKLRMWQTLSLILAAAAAGLGVVAGATKNAATNVWLAVLTTAIGTLTSFVFMSRFEFLAGSYLDTSQKLTARTDEWNAEADQGPEEAQRFILDCEAILAAQNQAWTGELSFRDDKVLSEEAKRSPLGADGARTGAKVDGDGRGRANDDGASH